MLCVYTPEILPPRTWSRNELFPASRRVTQSVSAFLFYNESTFHQGSAITELYIVHIHRNINFVFTMTESLSTTFHHRIYVCSYASIPSPNKRSTSTLLPSCTTPNPAGHNPDPDLVVLQLGYRGRESHGYFSFSSPTIIT